MAERALLWARARTAELSVLRPVALSLGLGKLVLCESPHFRQSGAPSRTVVTGALGAVR